MIYDVVAFNNIWNFKLLSCYTNIHLQAEKWASDSEQTFLVK